MDKVIVVTGGGTAGHIMPIIALIPEMKKHFDKIVYIGSKNGMEKDLVKRYAPEIDFFGVETIKFDRVKLLKNFKIPYVLLKGVKECREIYKQIKPSVIFSKGGYVSLPAVLASGKIPVVSHESDTTLGLANKIAYLKTSVLCTSFNQTASRYKKAVYTGLPIRNFDDKEKRSTFRFKPHLPILLVVGGSLGAKTINETLITIVDKLCEHFNIVHIVGRGNYSLGKFPINYNQFEFIDDLGYVYSVANYAVSRAGANAIAELLYHNIPMLLIPLSKKVSRGDQEQNAKMLKEKGYCNVLYSDNLTPQNLYNEIMFLKQTGNEIKQKQQKQNGNAVYSVMEQIVKTAKIT